MQYTVHTPDGRILAVQDDGDPDGWPILIHHGTPSSKGAEFYAPWVQDAKDRGLRIIAYDRPGFAGSTPHPGRTCADTAEDVRAICTELGIERLGTWGFSGGGQHALACAALLPDLVTAAAELAGVAPYGVEGLNWTDGMSEGDIEETELFFTDPAAVRRSLDAQREQILASTLTIPDDPAAAAEMILQRGSPEYMAFMRPANKAGLAPGGEGFWEENVLQLSPWGFDVADIRIPVLLMHGRKDKFVSFAHGAWLADHIPGVEARMFDEYGHGTLAEHEVPAVHAWLSDRR